MTTNFFNTVAVTLYNVTREHVKKYDGRGILQVASDDVAVRYILHLLSEEAQHIWVLYVDDLPRG